jgi:F-type H+-transporting ATPase subunit b
LAQQSREAAGEEKGENEEFKRSGSVQFLARVTGLSLEHAYWVAVLLNFAVIAVAIIWISRSKLPGLFRNRTQSIQKAMEEARRTSEDANRRLADIEARLSKLDTEINSMRATAEQESAAEEARIREAAELDARKVVEAAEQEIDAAAKTARRELKAYAAELAVSVAKQQILVDASTDQALVRNFSEQLGTVSQNGSGAGKDRR